MRARRADASAPALPPPAAAMAAAACGIAAIAAAAAASDDAVFILTGDRHRTQQPREGAAGDGLQCGSAVQSERPAAWRK